MKDRIWTAYFWIMIAYLGMALFVLSISLLTWNDREIYNGGKPSQNTAICINDEDSFSHLEICRLGADTPNFITYINKTLLFDFINYETESCLHVLGELLSSCSDKGINLRRQISVQNYYPFLLFFC